jgi:hypothetical protein
VALAEQRNMIRDSTLFHWWPRLRAKWRRLRGKK